MIKGPGAIMMGTKSKSELVLAQCHVSENNGGAIVSRNIAFGRG